MALSAGRRAFPAAAGVGGIIPSVTASVTAAAASRVGGSPMMSARFYSDDRDSYENPLTGRYTSPEMNYNWSPDKKFTTWRRLWIALAQAQQELGLDISDAQLAEMREHADDVNYDVADRYERELRHDVMSHIEAFGEQCPAARPIIHLGATSCFVGDNTDLIQMRDGMELLESQLLGLMAVLREQALKYKDLPTLGYTHLQPAQLTTVGKRMTLWLQDFLFDYQDLTRRMETLPFRGVKGTTGTHASFLDLFNGDHSKVRALDRRVTELMGFPKTIGVSGQTYTRKVDYQVLSVLSGIAQSATKMATDIRILANFKEIEEPFAANQVGSSAMPYKRNPMRSERICSLARHVMVTADNTVHTHANQWMERTLDDSANRRLALPEAFLGTDVVLRTCANVIDGIQVWPHVIQKRIEAELPFMATENIIMAGVKAGGDRQTLHKIIRDLSMEAGYAVKAEGKDNDLIDRIEAHDAFAAVKGSIRDVLSPENFVGRAPEQVEEFVAEEIDPILAANADKMPSSDAVGSVTL